VERERGTGEWPARPRDAAEQRPGPRLPARRRPPPLARLAPPGRRALDLMIRASLGRRAGVAGPYLWLRPFAPFAAAPVIEISPAESVLGSARYTPLIETSGAAPEWLGTIENYRRLISDSLYWRAYLSSIVYAAGTTGLCLLMGFPMAYAIARAPKAWRVALL